MKNLEAFTQEALSSAITFMVQKDVSKYQKVLSWINDEIRINVYKGMATLERAEDNKEAKEIISNWILNRFPKIEKNYENEKNLFNSIFNDFVCAICPRSKQNNKWKSYE